MHTQTLARLISILGHPAILAPMVLLIVLAHRGSSLFLPAAATSISVASAVMLYSYWKVRTQKWRHVDASIPSERRSFNPTLAILLGLAGLIATQISGAQGLSFGFLLAGLIPVLAMLASRWVKLSHHVAFAIFTATWLTTVGLWLSFAGFVIAALIAWSRITLRRHTYPDVCGGLIAGFVTGGILIFLLHLTSN